jgi:hypothetical protein
MILPMSQPDLLDRDDVGIHDEVQTQVFGLLAALYPRNDVIERRRETRYPFPCLIHLTPVSRDGATPIGETIVVAGRDISEHGVGFYHQEILPHRRMIASVEYKRNEWVAFLIDVSWCRFTRGGWYESGGRLLESVLSPMEQSDRTAPS